MHEDDDTPIDRPMAPTIGEIVEKRLGRRELLTGLAASAGAAALAPLVPGEAGAVGASSLKFPEISHALGPTIAVAPGYRSQVLIRWGDPILGGSRAFDINRLSGAEQERQFGYNCDFIGYMPLKPPTGMADRGLLCVNNEYTNWELMAPGLTRRSDVWKKATRRQVEVEMAAHGHSIVEVGKLASGRWLRVTEGRYNRRLTATTPMRISGPAAGHDRLKTRADSSGTRVLGTVNNCAGGTTPWGTVLIAEENFHYYFGGDPKTLPAKGPERRNARRHGIRGRSFYGWYRFDERFDVSKEPNEMNRFGWIVEFDPYDPKSVPVKRTALGRFKHEGANVVINPDGRVVLYSGDDQTFEYVYKFVSRGRFDAKNPRANRNLLDEGTLYVARFDSDGTLHWLPLAYGRGPLTEKNGFSSQADVVIEARRAADLLGATPMDRPEEVEANKATGRVYVTLTKNSRRGRKKPVDAANPREKNYYGHIIEMIPPGWTQQIDHAAIAFKWDIFLLAGDPRNPEHKAKYHPDVSANGWFANPDNFGFDNKGRMWIGTDQGPRQPRNNIADGVYATDTIGDGRALTRCFFTAPVGAELCSPTFTPDNKTLFVAVQHPGEGSGFDDPLTRWPDFKAGMPPRPSVVAITKNDGGVIGG